MARNKKNTPIEYPELSIYGGLGPVNRIFKNGESCGHKRCHVKDRSKYPCPNCYRCRCKGLMIERRRTGHVWLERMAGIDKKKYLATPEDERKDFKLIIYVSPWD